MEQTDSKAFQRKIYFELEEKLKSLSWRNGASEAHGLLTGLACRGITPGEVKNRMHLFQISGDEGGALLEGLFELILRDLKNSEPVFNLLLPDDTASVVQRADEVANWCGGFVQGFCHDSDSVILQQSPEVQEIIQDLMDICGMQVNLVSGDDEEIEEEEKALAEVEEYLRVGVQLIYDEAVGLQTLDQASEHLH